MWGFPLWVGWWWGLRWIIVVLGYPKNGMDALYMRLVQKIIVARFGRDHLEGFWSSAMIHGMQDTMMTGSQGRSLSFMISCTNIWPHQLPWFEATWSWSGVVVSARSDKGVLISKPTAFDFVPSLWVVPGSRLDHAIKSDCCHHYSHYRPGAHCLYWFVGAKPQALECMHYCDSLPAGENFCGSSTAGQDSIELPPCVHCILNCFMQGK